MKDDERYKPILVAKSGIVAKGFSQRKGMKYDEIFASVARHISIWILLALIVIHGVGSNLI